MCPWSQDGMQIEIPPSMAQFMGRKNTVYETGKPMTVPQSGVYNSVSDRSFYISHKTYY